MKFIKYFLQAIVIYTLFLVIKFIGLSASRKLFAKFFNIIGPIIKSKNTINSNLEKLFGNYSEDKKKEIILKMWSSYGKLFVEYIFLFKFRRRKILYVDSKCFSLWYRGSKYFKSLFSFELITLSSEIFTVKTYK